MNVEGGQDHEQGSAHIADQQIMQWIDVKCQAGIADRILLIERRGQAVGRGGGRQPDHHEGADDVVPEKAHVRPKEQGDDDRLRDQRRDEDRPGGDARHEEADDEHAEEGPVEERPDDVHRLDEVIEERRQAGRVTFSRFTPSHWPASSSR